MTTSTVFISVKLAKLLGGSEVQIASGVQPSHSQRPCWGGHGRGLDWVRSQTVRLRQDSLEWGMKVIGYEKAEVYETCKW